MYPFNGSNNGTVNRMPRTKPEAAADTPHQQGTFGRTLGTTVMQALVLVVAIKAVDAVIEIALSRFRKPRPQQPGRARHEEAVAA